MYRNVIYGHIEYNRISSKQLVCGIITTTSLSGSAYLMKLKINYYKLQNIIINIKQ